MVDQDDWINGHFCFNRLHKQTVGFLRPTDINNVSPYFGKWSHAALVLNAAFDVRTDVMAC